MDDLSRLEAEGEWKFWAATLTCPIWLVPVAALAIAYMFIWLVANFLCFALVAVFGILGRDDWIDKLDTLPIVGGFQGD